MADDKIMGIFDDGANLHSVYSIELAQCEKHAMQGAHCTRPKDINYSNTSYDAMF